MISNGWLDWAITKAGPADKVNGGVNPVKGLFCHSAEGYEAGLWVVLETYPVSWHLSNLKDGRLYQHYPFSAQCWHATAANNQYVGMEHEGKLGEPLTAAQKANSRRVIQDLSVYYNWAPRRPTTVTDLTATLYEHKEVVRFGGTGSACPNGRIPWDELLGDTLANISTDGSKRIVEEGNFIVTYNNNIPVTRTGSTDGRFPGRLSKLFGTTWLWFRTLDVNGNLISPYWSPDEGD